MKKIAIPVDNNNVLDAHFGHARQFVFLTVENDKIVAEEKLTPPPHEPGVIPKWVAQQGATEIIAGGMGQKAIQIFNNNKVNVFVGAPQLNARELVNGFINESISFNANYCDH